MMYVSPKDPDSEETFNWDFGPMLLPGDSVAAFVSMAFEDSPDELVTFLSGAALSGNKISRKLGGGTLGEDYGLRCRVTTTLGETLDLTLRFVIAQN
jgi:hypothetical protein